MLHMPFVTLQFARNYANYFAKCFNTGLRFFFFEKFVVAANLKKKYALHGQFRFVEEQIIFKVGLKSI